MAKGKTQNQKLAFDFLLKRFQAQDAFARQDFYDAIPDWAPDFDPSTPETVPQHGFDQTGSW